MPSSPARDLRARHFSWQALGGRSLPRGHVVWLRIEPAAGDIGGCRGAEPPDEDLRIEETGEVSEVRVSNPSVRAVLLQANLVVTGGLQTRAIERSLVVPPRSTARARVRCVERGRWAPHADGQGEAFGVGGPVSLRMRSRMTMFKAQSLRATGTYGVDQRTVWHEVDAELDGAKVASSTRSYEAYLADVRKHELEAVDAGTLHPPETANALLARPRAGGFWLEAFPSPAVLARQAPALIADLAMPDPQPTPPGDVPVVEALMERIWSSPLHAIDAVAESIGEPFALADDEVAGELLLVGGRLAHLAISPARGR